MGWLLVTTLIVGLLGGALFLTQTKAPNEFADLSGFDLLLSKLSPKIYWCKYLENIGAYGFQLEQQFKEIQQLNAVSTDVLQAKFNQQEMTYDRYAKAMRATIYMLADNISKLVPLLETLDQNTENSSKGQSNLSNRIDQLMLLNREGIEKVNQLIVSLSHIQNITGPDDQSVKYLLQDLNELIERAKQY